MSNHQFNWWLLSSLKRAYITARLKRRLFQFGKQMRVISPDEVVKEYRARLEEVLE